MKARLYIVFVFFMCACNLQAQQEWESVNRSFGAWQLEQGLTATSNTMTNLVVRNTSGEPFANAQNDMNGRSAYLNLNWIENSPFEISFTVSNPKSDPWQYASEQVYWAIFVSLYKTDGSVIANQLGLIGNKYDQFVNGKVASRYYYYDSGTGWKHWMFSGRDIKDMQIKIVCNSTILSAYFEYYDGYHTLNQVFANESNIAGVHSIWIGVGSGAEVSVTNFSVRKKSLQGTVKPNIEKGDAYWDKKMWSDAIREYTNAISQGYQNVDIFLRRAYAYMMMNYNNNAIEDANRVLSYESNNENAYFVRGVSKLQINDDSGVADLRKAGEAGIAFLREFGLLDYYPDQNNSSNSNTRRQQTPSQQNMLKKDPNFKIK